MLDKYPDEMQVIVDRCSDYTDVLESEWKIVRAVPTAYGAMKAHRTMGEYNKSLERDYLHLEGN